MKTDLLTVSMGSSIKYLAPHMTFKFVTDKLTPAKFMTQIEAAATP